MVDRVVLTNWRRFPRARVSCDVVYGDRFQSWHSHTRDISLGGRPADGYHPLPARKTLALKISDPGAPETPAPARTAVPLHAGRGRARPPAVVAARGGA